MITNEALFVIASVALFAFGHWAAASVLIVLLIASAVIDT